MLIDYWVMVIDNILFISNKHSYKTLFQILPINSPEDTMDVTETLNYKYSPTPPTLVIHEVRVLCPMWSQTRWTG